MFTTKHLNFFNSIFLIFTQAAAFLEGAPAGLLHRHPHRRCGPDVRTFFKSFSDDPEVKAEQIAELNDMSTLATERAEVAEEGATTAKDAAMTAEDHAEFAEGLELCALAFNVLGSSVCIAIAAKSYMNYKRWYKAKEETRKCYETARRAEEASTESRGSALDVDH